MSECKSFGNGHDAVGMAWTRVDSEAHEDVASSFRSLSYVISYVIEPQPRNFEWVTGKASSQELPHCYVGTSTFLQVVDVPQQVYTLYTATFIACAHQKCLLA